MPYDEDTVLISVLIPSYNHASYIKESLYSVLSQDYKNLELLICDDGSTDGTWEIIQKLHVKCKERFVNTYVIQELHSGIHNSLSKLLSVAQGEYIFIIASDDIAKPYAISTLYNFLKVNNDYGLCVGDNAIIDSNSCTLSKKTIGSYFHDKELDENNKFGAYKILLHRNHIPNGYLIRRKIFDNFSYNPKTFEDYYTMLQISKCYKMKYIDRVLFSYRKHTFNCINSEETKKNLFEIEKNLFFSEREYCMTHNYFDSWAARIAKMILKYGDFAEARILADKAIDNRDDLLWANTWLGLLHIKNGSFQKASEYVLKTFGMALYKSELVPYIVYIINRMSNRWQVLYITKDIKKFIAHHLIIEIDKKFSDFLDEDAYFATKEYLSFVGKYTDLHIVLWKVYNKYHISYIKSSTFYSIRKKIVQHAFINRDKKMIKEIFGHNFMFMLSFFFTTPFRKLKYFAKREYKKQ